MKKRGKIFLTLITVMIILGIGSTDLVANTKYGRLTGVNWFGFETSNYVVHGIWTRDYKSMLQQIADLGFNCIRLPWCNEMLNKTPDSIQINEVGVDAYTGETGLNLDLEGLDSLGVMDAIIEEAGNQGLYIILDNHSRAAGGYMNETLWYTDSCPESKWISDWVSMANRYRNYSNVIGADLNNEPHGSTGSGMKPPASWGYKVSGYGDTDWRAAAIRCANSVSSANPNLLIIVEGVEEYPEGHGYWWGGNLKGVADYPISGISNLVYSPHEYGSSVHPQTWFSDPNFPNNMFAIWDEHFYFIKKQNIAPLLFGEFGITDSAAASPGSTDYVWFTTLMGYVGSDCSWTFWSWNPNSGDTGGILQSDWVTVHQPKYNLIKQYLGGGGPQITPPPSTPTPVLTEPPTPTPTDLSTPTPTNITDNLGDVNSDGSVDIVDALLIAQYYVGLNPSPFDTSVADTNCDGSIDIVDALLVAQYYVGLVNGFC
ncbi:MAG: cellulase family glycosylhydrolase [Spirochaetales bacterium]|nr:cellulase family glycosylhydrolase [Spirochaetales bacterium]